MNQEEIYDRLLSLQRENPACMDSLEIETFGDEAIAIRGIIWTTGMKELEKEFTEHFMLDSDRLVIA